MPRITSADSKYLVCATAHMVPDPHFENLVTGGLASCSLAHVQALKQGYLPNIVCLLPRALAADVFLTKAHRVGKF